MNRDIKNIIGIELLVFAGLIIGVGIDFDNLLSINNILIILIFNLFFSISLILLPLFENKGDNR